MELLIFNTEIYEAYRSETVGYTLINHIDFSHKMSALIFTRDNLVGDAYRLRSIIMKLKKKWY